MRKWNAHYTALTDPVNLEYTVRHLQCPSRAQCNLGNVFHRYAGLFFFVNGVYLYRMTLAAMAICAAEKARWGPMQCPAATVFYIDRLLLLRLLSRARQVLNALGCRA